MVTDMTDTKDQGYDLGDENLVDTAALAMRRGEYLLSAWDQFAAMELVEGCNIIPSADGLIVYLKHGLCTNLRFEMSHVTHRLRDSQPLDNLLVLAYPQWDGYSGNDVYPVDGYYEYEGYTEDGERDAGMYHEPNLFRNPKRKELLEWLVTSFLPEYIKHWSAE